MVQQAVVLSALGLAGNAMSAPAAMRAENHARRVLTDDSSVVQPPMPPGPIPTPKIPMDIPTDIPFDDLEARKAGSFLTEGAKALASGLGIGSGTVGSTEALEGDESAEKRSIYVLDKDGNVQKRKIGSFFTEGAKALASGLGIGSGTVGSTEALEGDEAAAEKRSDDVLRRDDSLLFIDDNGAVSKRSVEDIIADNIAGDAEKRALEERKGKLAEVGTELAKGIATGLGIGGGTVGTEEVVDGGEKLKRTIDGMIEFEKRKGAGGGIVTELAKGLATGLGIGGGTVGSEEALDSGEEPAEKLKRTIDGMIEFEKRKGAGGGIVTELAKGLATGLGIGGGTVGSEEALDSGEEPAEKLKRTIDGMIEFEKRKGAGGGIVTELAKGIATGLGIGGGTVGTEEAVGSEEEAAEKRAIIEERKGKLAEVGTELAKGIATGLGIGGGTVGTEEVVDGGEKLKRTIDDLIEFEKRKGGGGKTDKEGGGGIFGELAKGLATGLGIGGGTVGSEEALDSEDPAASPEAKRIVMPPPGGLPGPFPPAPIPTPGDIMDDELYTTLDADLGETE